MSEYIVKCKKHVGISGSTIQFPEYIDTNQEIVRCKDCKWRVDHVHNDVTTHKCSYMHGGPSFYFPVELDNFCCWGERKVVDL